MRRSGRGAVSRHEVESDISCQGVRFSVSDQTPGISSSSPTLLVHDHSREILRLGRILPSRYSLGLSFFFFFFSFERNTVCVYKNLFWDCRFQYRWLAAYPPADRSVLESSSLHIS